MSQWKQTIDINSLILKWDEETITFEQLRDQVTARLQGLSPELNWHAAELQATECEEDFDEALGELYDYCDDQRIWLG